MPKTTDIYDFADPLTTPEMPSLDVTWWLLKEEPGFDDIYEKAGKSLEKLMERYSIHPLQVDGKPVLYLGRFEFPKYDEDFEHPEAIFVEDKEVVGFVDFLAGFPLECVEMLAMVGEWSSKPDKEQGRLAVLPGDKGAAAPVPQDFFAGYPEDKVLLNLIYLDTDYARTMADGLEGEPEPKGLRWWVRVNLKKGGKYPVPGEFFALAVRMMPDQAWGEQKSSPFLYSGNWMDTVFYTSGRITAIDPANDNRPYPLYTVRWRNQDIQMAATDFNEYQVGDLVTLIKDVATEKTSQLWKDDDAKQPGENWSVAPIIFYNAEIYSREEG
jgi:hypothetical protein